MPKSATVKIRVTKDQKAGVRSVCRQKGITESAFVRQIMEAAADGAREAPCVPAPRTDRFLRSSRVSVRLRPDDGLLLWERARTHKLSISAYAARIVRDHVQARLPLPTAELEALRTSVDEVNAIGRMLNDMARALNQKERVRGPTIGELKTLLGALVRLRDHIRTLTDTNGRSWLAPGDLNK